MTELQETPIPDPEAAERDRERRLSDLIAAVENVVQRGMAFQDEDWWPEVDSLHKKFSVQY